MAAGLLAGWLALGAPAEGGVSYADVFQLSNGGQIEGRLLNRDQVPRATYEIETASGARLVLPKSEVARVVRRSEVRLEYEAVRPTFPDTVAGQLELAAWCQERGLSSLRKVHLARVIELDPDNQAARRGLGHRLVAGKWLTYDELMQSRGRVRYNNSWKLPQEIEILERKRKDDLAEREWFRRLKDYRQQLSTAERPAAIEALRSISDPYALKAIDEWFAAETEAENRLLLVDALRGIDDPGAHSRLAQAVLADAVEEVRLAALDHLRRSRPPAAIDVFLRALRSKENQTVNRAAVGLAQLEARDAVGPLIEALVTTHKFVIQTGGANEYTATFARPDADGVIRNPGPGGVSGGGLTMGSSVQVVTRKIRNLDVRDALVALTRTNYDFDERAWRAWLAAQKKPSSLDSRRD